MYSKVETSIADNVQYIASTFISLIYKQSIYKHYQNPHLTSSKLLQTSKITIEDIRITTPRTLIAILPDSLSRPPARNSARRTSIPCQNQRRRILERLAISRTRRPPRRIGIQHRIPRSLLMIGIRKLLYPRHHARVRQAPALRMALLRLEINHARQRDTILGPAPAVLDEEFSLGGCFVLAGVGEVVCAADEFGLGGAGVVLGEGLVCECNSLGGLFQVSIL